jgi:hypothetical protein
MAEGSTPLGLRLIGLERSLVAKRSWNPQWDAGSVQVLLRRNPIIYKPIERV